MAVKAQSSVTQLRVTGIDALVPVNKIRMWATDVAESIEERIAEDFDNERGNGRALKANSEAYTDAKASQGYDTRRGHRTGDLQAVLDRGGHFIITASMGRCTIIFNENALRADAGHAEHYAAAKVSGGRLLTFLHKDAAFAAEYFNDRQAEVIAKERMKAARRVTRKADSRLVYEQTRATGARAVRVRVA